MSFWCQIPKVFATGLSQGRSQCVRSQCVHGACLDDLFCQYHTVHVLLQRCRPLCQQWPRVCPYRPLALRQGIHPTSPRATSPFLPKRRHIALPTLWARDVAAMRNGLELPAFMWGREIFLAENCLEDSLLIRRAFPFVSFVLVKMALLKRATYLWERGGGAELGL